MEELGQITSDLEQRQEALNSNLQNLSTVDQTKNLMSEIANISQNIAQNNETISMSSVATNLISEIIKIIRARWLGSSYQHSVSIDPPTDKSHVPHSNPICNRSPEADLECETGVELSEATNNQDTSADDSPSDSTFGFDDIRRGMAREYITNKVRWWMDHKNFNIAENPYASIRLTMDLPTTHPNTPESLADKQSSSLITCKSESSLKRATSLVRQSKRLKCEREKFRVAMSHVSKKGKRKETVEKLGGTVVESAENATVLLADKFLRTVKILVAIGRAIPIVGPDWLEASEKIDCFLDPWDYLLYDPTGEERFACHLKTTLQKSVARKKKPLLAEWSIFVTKNVRPPPDAMKAVVKSCGGNYMNRVPKGPWPKNSRIISCEEDLLELKKMKHRPTVVKVEWILRGIVMQRIECDDKYELAI